MQLKMANMTPVSGIFIFMGALRLVACASLMNETNLKEYQSLLKNYDRCSIAAYLPCQFGYC